MVFSKFFLKVDKYKILNYYVYIYIYIYITWLNKDILPPIFTRFRVVVVQKVIFKIKKVCIYSYWRQALDICGGNILEALFISVVIFIVILILNLFC